MTSLRDRLDAVDRALELGGDGRLTGDERAQLERVRAQAGERVSRGEDAVVVALAGGTGSGKSSLFNALAGQELAGTGVRRPVTTAARALAVGDPERSSGLLDWLEVGHRHHAPADARLPEGLVLVDLPDHDSVEIDHHRVVDRFVERVDVLVWVVDPKKYAQRALHVGYLRELTTHAEVLLVVLNRADELDENGRADVEADLRALLAAEGLGDARVLVTSATTGLGVDALRHEIAEEARARHAVATRIAADVTRAARRIVADLEPVPAPPDVDRTSLIPALAEALGLEGVGRDAHRAYVEDARRTTRPFVSGALIALLALVIRPLRRWRSERARRRTIQIADRSGGLPIGVRHAVLDLATGGLEVHPRWRTRLRDTGEDLATRLTGSLGRELDRVDLTPRPRGWWMALAAVWTAAELVLLTGAGWLVVSGVLVWLQLPALPSPEGVGAVPLPTVLLLGGGTAWGLLALLRRRGIATGARRHGRLIDRQVATLLADTARDVVVAPLEVEVELIRDLEGRLATAAG